MTENMKSTGESIDVALNELHPFPNHPFKVEQDEAFDALVESIRNHGVLHRIIIRPRESGGYEIVAGHRRVEACRKLGLTEIIADLRRDMGNDQAILAMIDTNLKQRPNLLPSERARAYRMMRDTLKHQGKKIELDAKGTRATKEMIAQLYGDSGRKVSRFIRLTYLISDLLDHVDQKKLKLGPAIQISFLEEEVQEWIAEDYSCTQQFPSVEQVKKMRKAQESDTLDFDAFEDRMPYIDYVVLHELVHFLYPNHSKQFYAFLSNYMPDWKERKRILDQDVVHGL